MDVNDLIRNKMIIKKPAKISNYKANDDPKPQRKVKSTARNAGLYEPEKFDLSDIEPPKKTSTEAEISSQIFEINGGDTFTDRSMVENWNKMVDSGGNNSKTFKVPKDNCFKRNPLMRGLLLQKMSEMKLADDESSHSASGKDKKNTDVNGDNIDGPYLIQSAEDPDFYYLRDTSKCEKVVDDGFRFSFRGIKETTTPRAYAINEVTEEDFVFRK